MIIFLWIMCGVLTGVIASNKGRSVGLWALYGFALGPLAVIHAFASHTNTTQVEADAVAAGTLRKCPFCAELVKREALICRHCRSELPRVDVEPLTVRVQPAPGQPVPVQPASIIPATQRLIGRTLLGVVFAIICALAYYSTSRNGDLRQSKATTSRAEDVGACADRGVAYFYRVDSSAKLIDGRDPRSEALERCNRTTTAF